MSLSPHNFERATSTPRLAPLAKGLAIVALVLATCEAGHVLAAEPSADLPAHHAEAPAHCRVGSGTIHILNLNIQLVPQAELHYLAIHRTGQLLAEGCGTVER